MHSGIPDGVKRKRPIKKLDLEKFHSCTRQIDEVDIGPCSPIHTPSKLLLSDGNLDSKSGCMKPTANLDKKPSKELFLNQRHIHRPCSQLSTDNAKEDQSLEKSLKSPLFSFESKKEHSDTDVTHKQPNEFIFSKPDCSNTNNKVKAKFDPYVSEDFQVTPLVRYTKKHPPGNIRLDKSKKKKHSDGTNGQKVHETTEKKGCYNLKVPYFSSTPISVLHSVKSDKVKTGEHFGGISPIGKGVTFSETRPIIRASGKKWDHIGASQYPEHRRNIKESCKEQFISDTSCNSAQHSNESSEESIKQKEIYEYNHGKLSRQSSTGNLHDHWRNKKNITSNVVSSSRLQFDSLSKYDLTENIFDSSLSGDSLVHGTEHEILGSLAKYKNVVRHTNDLESPFLHGNSDSFKEPEEKNKKTKIDKRFESSVSKSNFDDFTEDKFHHLPLRTKSVKMAPELININPKFGQEKVTDFRTGNNYCMSENTMTAASRLQGGLVPKISSPVPGEEFPKHLLSPSKQLQEEIDQKLSEIIAEERKIVTPLGRGTVVNRQIVNRLQNDGARCYKAMTNHIADVLTEMKHLEEQDSASPEAPFDKVPRSTSIENPDN